MRHPRQSLLSSPSRRGGVLVLFVRHTASHLGIRGHAGGCWKSGERKSETKNDGDEMVTELAKDLDITVTVCENG